MFKKLVYNLSKFVPDRVFLKILFRKYTGNELNLKNPRTFNEKLQWLKLYNHNPLYTNLVDKYEVKRYVSDLIGEEYIIPTLGVWKSFDEIDFENLPQQFVLKCTHDSGGIVIVQDKSKFDKEAAKKKIEKCLKDNFYYKGREWPYKNVHPKIIAEKYMVDESGTELKDYKFFSFNGKVKMIQVDYDRYVFHKRNLYTTNWEYIDETIQYPTDRNHIIAKPIKLEKMIELVEILSEGIPHVRVDFYSIGEKIYFGEMTFFHGSGFEKFSSRELEYTMGDWISLPRSKETF